MIVAELPGTPDYELAVKDGFSPMGAAEAVQKAAIITILLPDELQAERLPQPDSREPQARQRACLT